MKTRFQSSMKRSGSVAGLAGAGSSGRRSMWISLHGPAGPVSPICQKLSLRPIAVTRDAGTPASFSQKRAASSSPGKSASPAKTVACSRSAGSR